MRRFVIAVACIFALWATLDLIIHGLILGQDYLSTMGLWRPITEMRMGLIYFTVLIFATVFVTIYVRFFRERGITVAVQYGFILGLGIGISMGYGTYAVMPIPYKMALVWFLGTLFETTMGGLVLGAIIGEKV